jgi:hypothetical protein
MQINWLGQGGIKITTKDSKGEKRTVIIDPPDPESGIKVRGGIDADLVIFSGSKSAKLSIDKTATVIETPGEYEIKGIGFLGKQVGESIIWRLALEGMTLGHLGKLSKNLSENERAFMTGLDILVVPVGGKDVLGATQAADVVRSLEPKIIIPTYFSAKGAAPAGGQGPASGGKMATYETVDKFCKESSCPMERMEKLTLHKKDIPAEGMKMIILEP